MRHVLIYNNQCAFGWSNWRGKKGNTWKEMREMFSHFTQWDPRDVPGGTKDLLLVSQSDFTLTVTCQPRDLVVTCH